MKAFSAQPGPDAAVVPRLRAFRNLTRGCFSLQVKVPGGGWRTVAHADAVLLEGATFIVSEAERRRVVTTGHRTVHAWVEGRLAAWSGSVKAGARYDASGILGPSWCPEMPDVPAGADTAVTYDPLRFPTFVTRSDRVPVGGADAVHLGAGGAVALRPVPLA